jgi:hypothetical protein
MPLGLDGGNGARVVGLGCAGGFTVEGVSIALNLRSGVLHVRFVVLA